MGMSLKNPTLQGGVYVGLRVCTTPTESQAESLTLPL